MSRRFNNSIEFSQFMYTLCDVVPVQFHPDYIILSKEELDICGKPTTWLGPTKSIKLIDRDTFALEQKYNIRLNELERRIKDLEDSKWGSEE